jgi:hypothetical protein
VAGYSGTPLVKKLGIKTGDQVLLVGAPPGYRALLEPLPERVRFSSRLSGTTDLVQFFCTRSVELKRRLTGFRGKMKRTAVVWVSWPKKAAGAPTDITEDVIREVALPLGLVDVKVCAVDEVWSGLKLVIRRALR